MHAAWAASSSLRLRHDRHQQLATATKIKTRPQRLLARRHISRSLSLTKHKQQAVGEGPLEPLNQPVTSNHKKNQPHSQLDVDAALGRLLHPRHRCRLLLAQADAAKEHLVRRLALAVVMLCLLFGLVVCLRVCISVFVLRMWQARRRSAPSTQHTQHTAHTAHKRTACTPGRPG